MAMIHEAICSTMNDVGAVAKKDDNSYDKYKYRGIDAVMNALNPAMRKNGIFVVPEVLEHHQEERTSNKGGMLIYTTCKVKYTFYAKDGSFLDAVVVGEAMDRSDKSTNKAMSAAFKYACFQTFCIPTEEMMDTEAESPEAEPKKPQRGTQKATKASAETPPQSAYPDVAEMVKTIGKAVGTDKKAIQNITDEIKRCGVKNLSEVPLPVLQALYQYYVRGIDE